MSENIELTREQKIKLVKQDITKMHIMKMFEELINSGGGSYSAGSGIQIDENNVISVVIGDLIDSGSFVVTEDGKIALSSEIAKKIDAIPEVEEGDVFVTTSNIQDVLTSEPVRQIIENVVAEQLLSINPWTEYNE